jgi:hypothetical protein
MYFGNFLDDGEPQPATLGIVAQQPVKTLENA